MRFFKPVIVPVILITIFTACKKNSSSVNLTPNFYFINGGVTDTANTLLLFSSSDTITYNLVISSTYFISKNVLVTIGVADEYRDSYNTTYNTNYQPMPDGAYSFRDTITATTSTLYDTIPVTVYKHALSADKQYMLPIHILDAGGYQIDTATSIIYLRTVNNILSGIYNSACTKIMYNGDATDSTLSSIDSFTIVKSLIPQPDNSSQLDYADLGANGWKYILGFSSDNNNAFFVLPNDVIKNSVQANTFQVLAESFDSTTRKIYIKTSYKNSSGNQRIVEESLTLH